MKKKTFYQTNILYQLLCFLFLAMSVIGLIVGVELIIGFVKNGLGSTVTNIVKSIFLMILYFSGVFFIAIKPFIQIEHNNIHLTDEKIYMNDDWDNTKSKIQYYSEVKFIDIEAVDIIWTNKNCKGKAINSGAMADYVEKPYLSIKNNKGEVINFFIMYIAKKDVVKMISEIKLRMRMVGNRTPIIKEEDALIKLNKKIYIDI